MMPEISLSGVLIVAVGGCVLLRLTTPGWLLVVFFIFVPVATVALVTQIVLAAAAVPRRRLTTSVSLAFGLTVLTGAYALGHISGGHFNPAVSFGLWAGGRFPARELVPYIVAQVLGGPPDDAR